MYIGRFAPTPSGPLHFGSIIAALGSYLQARGQQGKWLLRIEDLDTPRNQPGALDNILYLLDQLGLHWDGPVMVQSQRIAVYEEILELLAARGLTYPCSCTRYEIKGKPYSGTCRNGITSTRRPRALRVRTHSEPVGFQDRIQGHFRQQLEQDIGDFILRRSDGLIAYHLAVVVDDVSQGVTEIVRGADLLDSTPRQIYLQNLLNYATPEYVHLPVANTRQGRKISKQNHAPGIDPQQGPAVLFRALQFLGQQPDPALATAGTHEIIAWGIEHWQLSAVPACPSIQLEG